MQLVTDLVESAMPLAESEDALDAELAGAMLLATMLGDVEDPVAAFTQALIPQVEAVSGRGAIAFLQAVGAVSAGTHPEVATSASAAAARLAAAGVPEPDWAGDLAAPVQVGDCVRLSDAPGTISVLAAPFRRGGRGHAFLVMADEQACGAAENITIGDAAELPALLENLREGARADGVELHTQHLDPAEWRWYAEQALDIRADHDAEDAAGVGGQIDMDADDEPPFPVLAMLMRSRLAALPAPRRPAGASAGHREPDVTQLLSDFASLTASLGGQARTRLERAPQLPLPPKRTKSAGPAPIYQLKVTLKGSKPPIWRRLLVPANENLTRLHAIMQAAFGWEDAHLHVFETPYGSFGRADQELGHKAGAGVTLEQVAPQAKDKITYVYDFGDDWEHEIAVEKIIDRDPALSYPYCSGGRRAAPPEDCGGVWGYAETLAALADPEHPEHQDRLEWLGLTDGSQFDPAAFDVDAVNRALPRRRQR
jgi:hypothetical protein